MSSPKTQRGSEMGLFIFRLIIFGYYSNCSLIFNKGGNMEEELREDLRAQITYDLGLLKQQKPGSEEHERLSKEIVSLTQALDRLNQSEVEAYDKQERRETDAKSKQQLYELEVQKTRIDWKRWGLDMVKVLIPGLVGWMFYTANQEKLLKYEEEGRVTSDTGRQGTRLPNPFNFFKK